MGWRRMETKRSQDWSRPARRGRNDSLASWKRDRQRSQKMKCLGLRNLIWICLSLYPSSVLTSDCLLRMSFSFLLAWLYTYLSPAHSLLAMPWVLQIHHVWNSSASCAHMLLPEISCCRRGTPNSTSKAQVRNLEILDYNSLPQFPYPVLFQVP